MKELGKDTGMNCVSLPVHFNQPYNLRFQMLKERQDLTTDVSASEKKDEATQAYGDESQSGAKREGYYSPINAIRRSTKKGNASIINELMKDPVGLNRLL